jgi:hypothetical protein
MEIMKEYSVTQILPDDRQRVLCFGYLTHCCVIDMDKEPDWHEVTFRFDISFYKLKHNVPEDPEESILETCGITENWYVGEESLDGHVLGVTKWKFLEKQKSV